MLAKSQRPLFWKEEDTLPVTISRTPFEDFEELQHLVQDSRAEIVQLDTGKMTGTLTHFVARRRIWISTGSFSKGMRSSGIMSRNRFALASLTGIGGEVVGSCSSR